jgi:3-(methylsulfanyl)propanoyl-CoA dehydrogenase
MTVYQAPQRDMQFVMDEVLDFPAHYASLPGCDVVTQDLVSAIREGGAKFATNILAPLNPTGDQQGCRWQDGVVTTPEGFKEACRQFCDAGWPGLTHASEYGGQGLPTTVGIMFTEMMSGANVSWSVILAANSGALETLNTWGTKAQKDTYMNKIVSGEWSGTMCLTESHCGTDLGLLRTKAEPNADGSYRVTGTKIFISEGEHDKYENIVHIVLARLPDAPAGVKGISLFLVPKFIPNAEGEKGERNSVYCGSIEHKMGLHASPTCVMNFEGAQGHLVGPPNKGLNCMFTFMNNARLSTAVQGMVHAEVAFQKSLAYAKDRLQMRALSGPKNPELPADPIIVHPDVRRMLLTQKAYAEGGRMLNYYIAKLLDVIERSSDDDAKKEADDTLGLLTPIAKAFLTETGFESANLGLQCFGGHGYIKEWGVEQNVRDSRISCLYEGTTGVQALDLLGRKILMTQGGRLRNFTKKIHTFCEENKNNNGLSEFVEELAIHNKEWLELVVHIGGAAEKNPEEVGAASVDFLMYSGLVVLAYFWAQAVVCAQKALREGTTEEDFYQAKIKTARFFFKRLLPKTRGYVATLKEGADSLMDLDAEHFSF